jgi:3-methylcrotonyl-CoA carboxylase alpha subunit
MFRKLLIANRGEIACRTIRTARRMGIATVAVYSDADRNALHVRAADEAIHIGASPSAESYLRIDRIIEAARKTGAEAVHPGYGFLSENPDFADELQAAGIIFVGPPASAIRAMGLKDAAKRLMEKAGVPVVPGYHGSSQDERSLLNEAKRIGFPVFIKARAGGGGKGMRRVNSEHAFALSLAGARREAEASFGDARVLIEKSVSSPRHIEFQIFGDNHGNVLHLFERDCSLQRRHQKVIEEAPAPGMTPEMRKAMGKAAVNAAKAVNYSGAGTVEFIVDATQGLRPDRFWFMEMNTRIQVEHPVTEEITGVDLVEWQLRVAAGELLPLKQDEIAINGHAMEARIYAEDPARSFLPSPGCITHLHFPEEGARIETGVVESDTIGTHYDPMIAKLIVHAPDRMTALQRMEHALRETRIAGVTTNVPFLMALCHDPHFTTGIHDTGHIDGLLPALTLPAPVSEAVSIAAACVMCDLHVSGEGMGAWGLWGSRRQFVDFSVQDRPTAMCLSRAQNGRWSAEYGGRAIPFEFTAIAHNSCRIAVENSAETFDFTLAGQVLTIFAKSGVHVFTRRDIDGAQTMAQRSGSLSAPIPSLVSRIFVSPGATVKQGEPLLVVEAMKMEHTIISPQDGVIESILTREGDRVAEGALLVKLKDPSLG